MLLTVPHGGKLGRFLVRLVHVFPPSRVTWTRPSFVPAHSRPFSRGYSAMADTVDPYSWPVLCGVRPPDSCCLLLSLRVRSGLMTSQLCPRLVVRCTCWLPTYTV